MHSGEDERYLSQQHPAALFKDGMRYTRDSLHMHMKYGIVRRSFELFIQTRSLVPEEKLERPVGQGLRTSVHHV